MWATHLSPNPLSTPLSPLPTSVPTGSLPVIESDSLDGGRVRHGWSTLEVRTPPVSLRTRTDERKPYHPTPTVGTSPIKPESLIPYYLTSHHPLLALPVVSVRVHTFGRRGRPTGGQGGTEDGRKDWVPVRRKCLLYDSGLGERYLRGPSRTLRRRSPHRHLPPPLSQEWR